MSRRRPHQRDCVVAAGSRPGTRREPRRRPAGLAWRYAVSEDHLRSWFERQPIVGFVLLAFGISYLVGGPALLAGASLIPARAALLHTYAPRILVVFGPGLAALVLAQLSRRDGGAAGLVRRLVPSWADMPWAAATLLGGAAASTAALCVAGVSPQEIGRAVSGHGGLLAAHGALQLGIVATGEELGWRGWLLPRLVERTNRLKATLVTAGLWGIWHGPLLVTDAGAAIMFCLMVFGLSALFTWFWTQTCGRLFVVVVAHAAVNTPLFFWEQVGVFPGHDGEGLRIAWYTLEAIYVTAGLVLVITRWRWWTEWSRPRAAAA